MRPNVGRTPNTNLGGHALVGVTRPSTSGLTIPYVLPREGWPRDREVVLSYNHLAVVGLAGTDAESSPGYPVGSKGGYGV